MTCEAVATFPQASVAVQVRVIVYSHPGVVITSSNSTNTSSSQLSTAVTRAGSGIWSQLTVMSSTTPTISGAVKSVTVMTWVNTVELPQSSVAVQDFSIL